MIKELTIPYVETAKTISAPNTRSRNRSNLLYCGQKWILGDLSSRTKSVFERNVDFLCKGKIDEIIIAGKLDAREIPKKVKLYGETFEELDCGDYFSQTTSDGIGEIMKKMMMIGGDVLDGKEGKQLNGYFKSAMDGTCAGSDSYDGVIGLQKIFSFYTYPGLAIIFEYDKTTKTGKYFGGSCRRVNSFQTDEYWNPRLISAYYFPKYLTLKSLVGGVITLFTSKRRNLENLVREHMAGVFADIRQEMGFRVYAPSEKVKDMCRAIK